jgi:hypothetical protein
MKPVYQANVKDAFAKLKIIKAPGDDDITVKMLKNFHELVLSV